MYSVLLATLFLPPASDFGPAPDDTADPLDSVERLLAVFQHCEFSAEQDFQSNSPLEGEFSEKKQIKCIRCDNSIVLKTLIENTPDGGYELKWTRDVNQTQLDLAVSKTAQWPHTNGAVPGVRVNNILVYELTPRSQREVWQNILLSHFLTEPNTGTTLIDLVTEGGRCDYSLQKVAWASEDHSSAVRYHYTSPDYGTTYITLSRSGSGWRPTEIGTEKLTSDKTYLVGAVESTVQSLGYSRMTRTYLIRYDDEDLPTSIVLAEEFAGDAGKAIDTRTLTFTELKTGEVTCEDVRKAALPIRDGIVAVQRDPTLKGIAYTTQDGEIVREIDASGVAIGQQAEFSSRGGNLMVIVNLVLFVIVGGFVFYRMKRRQ